MMTYLALSKAGYGTLKYLIELDTPELLDIIEFENIRCDIETYEMENARNK